MILCVIHILYYIYIIYNIWEELEALLHEGKLEKSQLEALTEQYQRQYASISETLQAERALATELRASNDQLRAQLEAASMTPVAAPSPLALEPPLPTVAPIPPPPPAPSAPGCST